MKRIITIRILFLLFLCLAQGLMASSFNNRENSISEADSMKVEQLYEQSREAIEGKDYTEALAFAQKAWNISVENAYNRGKGKSSLMMGLAYKNLNDLSSSLNYFLQSNKLFENLKDPDFLVKSYQGTGELYMQWLAYEKAASYFSKSLEISEKQNLTLAKAESLKGLGQSYMNLDRIKDAEHTYEMLLSLLQVNQDKAGEIETLGKLAYLSKLEGNFQKVDAYNQQRLEKSQAAADVLTEAYVLNSFGFSKKKQGNTAEALNYFERSLAAFKKSDQANPFVLTNIGVAYTNLSDFNNARKSYQEAKAIFEKNADGAGAARSLNYLAANSYINGNSEQAVKEVNQAIEIAKAGNHDDVLQESYKILSEIYNHEENFKDAQNYYKLHKELSDKLAEEQRQKAEQMLENLLEAEKKENELQLVMAEKDRQELAYKQLELEAEKKEQALSLQEKELALLKQQQELQEARIKGEQLEKERVRQELELAQKQLEAEKRQQDIESLEREKERQGLELRQKELEEKERQKALELVEAENKLKDQKLEEEALQRRYTYWLFGLVFLILVVILYGFYQKQKATRILKKQALEIKSKNEELSSKNDQLMVTEEELRQNMEELQTTQDQLEQQNKMLALTYQELEEKNTALTDSIRYAETIQAAILPTPKQLNALFQEHMVIYLPKDVVSGDFYWLSHFEKTSVLAVVDCTGHGVPGAFMSMIGASLLNQIINEKKITDPAMVLEMMNKGVRKSLRQNDSSNSDGMDILLTVIEELPNGKSFNVKFSGAKTSLYYYTNGSLQELKGDRKGIGGLIYSNTDKKFTTQEVELQKGDTLFLTTDGFIDAANQERKRFGSAKLKELLQAHGELSLANVRNVLIDALHEHQLDTPQRDDISLLGIRM